MKTSAKTTTRKTAKKTGGAKVKIKSALSGASGKKGLATQGKKLLKDKMGLDSGHSDFDISELVGEIVEAGAQKLAEVANTKLKKAIKNLEGRVSRKLG